MKPILAQIQEWDRSPPQPIAADRLKTSTPVPGEGGAPLRRVLLKELGHTTYGVPNGSKKDTRCKASPSTTGAVACGAAPPARWPAVQDRWLRLSGGAEPHICPSHPSLQPIQHRGRRFEQGQAVAFGGGEWGLGGEGVHQQALAGEGAGGAGQLPGVGDQQHGSAGVVLAQPGGGAGGVLPGGAGSGVAGDAAGGDTELHETLGGGAGVARHIGRQRGVAAELDGGAAGGGGGDGVAAAEQHHHRSGRGRGRGGQLALQPATKQSSGGGAVDGAEGQGQQQARARPRAAAMSNSIAGVWTRPSSSSRRLNQASGAGGQVCHCIRRASALRKLQCLLDVPCQVGLVGGRVGVDAVAVEAVDEAATSEDPAKLVKSPLVVQPGSSVLEAGQPKHNRYSSQLSTPSLKEEVETVGKYWSCH